jgi:hypothetical protein
MVTQWKSYHHMHIPIPGVIDDPSVRLHQSRNDSFYGPAHIFAPQIESANQMEPVLREKVHLQPGFVRCKPVATRFVPAHRFLASLDSVSFTIFVGVQVRNQNRLNFFLYIMTLGLMKSRVPVAECTLPGRSFAARPSPSLVNWKI